MLRSTHQAHAERRGTDDIDFIYLCRHLMLQNHGNIFRKVILFQTQWKEGKEN